MRRVRILKSWIGIEKGNFDIFARIKSFEIKVKLSILIFEILLFITFKKGLKGV